MKEVILLWCLALLIFAPRSGAQTGLNMPVLRPSYVHDFSEKASFAGLSFKKFIQGEDKRIWLDSGINWNVVNDVHIVQFDGYEYAPVQIQNSELSDQYSFLCSITKNQEILGYTPYEFVFLFDLKTQKLKKFDFREAIPEGVVKNVIVSRRGEIFVLVAMKQTLALFSIWQNDVKELRRIEAATNELQFWQYSVKSFPLAEDEEGLLFSSVSFSFPNLHIQVFLFIFAVCRRHKK